VSGLAEEALPVGQSTHPLVGQALPTLNVAEWLGSEIGPADLAGKIVVIDFWATWCAPCLGAIPKNNALAEKYRAQGVQFIGVCATTGAERMAETARDRQIAYPIAKDVAKTTEKALHVRFFPCYFVVDRHGIVRAAGLTPSKVEPVLCDVLAEQPDVG
jgi:thiol-disulfide isomerase/thioredoxin